MPRSKKTAAPGDSSVSPPPLPNEPLPSTAAEQEVPADVPIASLGGDDSEDEDQGTSQGSQEAAVDEVRVDRKGKGKAVEGSIEGENTEGETTGGEAKSHPWQAVWSEEKNAWYFWNTTSGEVTWTNPLSTSTHSSAPPLPSGPVPASKPQAPLPAQRQFGVLPEIDPALAFLLPPEARGGASDPSAQSAMFNARTGRFTANDYMYNVDHLDEYNRMKRMNNQYFDQDAWERDMAEHNAKRKRDAEAGVAPKPLSKKDVERFKKQKQEKRLRGQAWLRD